tara:strand:+ start:1372 stop:1554 length:183 start_codon:yes stop_codon:yes gene_type:complete
MVVPKVSKSKKNVARSTIATYVPDRFGEKRTEVSLIIDVVACFYDFFGDKHELHLILSLY